jgi:acylphosphatase
VKRVRVIVSGWVQGVFYRATCAAVARELGLGGYVRNLPDGRVEAAFEGPEADVDAMVAWCRHGPDLARVDGVEIVPEPLRGEVGFRVTG